METELINKSREHAESILIKLPQEYVYHNIKHTSQVVQAALEIGRACQLSEDDMETTLIAAWIHDTGYSKGCDGHEHNSAATAKHLLTQWGASDKKIHDVITAIKATQMPQSPKNLVSEVLCDADLYHLSLEELPEQSDCLRKEMVVTRNRSFNDMEWLEYNLNFLQSHTYFTDYGKTVLEARKQKNIKRLKKKLKKVANPSHLIELEEEVQKLKKKLDKKSKPERGIETMFRITSQNHIRLSEMADTKANIMVSINAIVLSVVVTVLFRKLEEFPALLLPTMMLVSSCLLTIIYAVLATRPNISSGKFTMEDIEQRKTNLLFFGNFHGMDLHNYEHGVKEMMKDADFLYGSIIKDIYYNGKVLARKYRLLRKSYSIFMFGFVASILAFIISMLIFYYPR